MPNGLKQIWFSQPYRLQQKILWNILVTRSASQGRKHVPRVLQYFHTPGEKKRSTSPARQKEELLLEETAANSLGAGFFPSKSHPRLIANWEYNAPPSQLLTNCIVPPENSWLPKSVSSWPFSLVVFTDRWVIPQAKLHTAKFPELSPSLMIDFCWIGNA